MSSVIRYDFDFYFFDHGVAACEAYYDNNNWCTALHGGALNLTVSTAGNCIGSTVHGMFCAAEFGKCRSPAVQADVTAGYVTYVGQCMEIPQGAMRFQEVSGVDVVLTLFAFWVAGYVGGFLIWAIKRGMDLI